MERQERRERRPVRRIAIGLALLGAVAPASADATNLYASRVHITRQQCGTGDVNLGGWYGNGTALNGYYRTRFAIFDKDGARIGLGPLRPTHATGQTYVLFSDYIDDTAIIPSGSQVRAYVWKWNPTSSIYQRKADRDIACAG